MHRSILFVLLPALAVALLYLLFLGHRSDYAGHYMAGFGGTLFAIMAVQELRRQQGRSGPAPLPILIVFLVCVAFGTLLEATTFRLAKFDEVDYCNQNLGATVAALASLAALPDTGDIRPVLGPSLFIGIGFIIAGFIYAFA